MNVALAILFTTVNLAFIVTLMLTAWFAVRTTRAERLILTRGPEEMSPEELTSKSSVDVEQSGTSGDTASPAEPSVPGPEA